MRVYLSVDMEGVTGLTDPEEIRGYFVQFSEILRSLAAINAGDHVKFGFPMAFSATMLAWVPLMTILAYAVVIAMAQLAGLDFLGEMAGLLF